jgi:hypothetical protein
VKFDISTKDSQIKFNSPKKWAKEAIKLKLDFAYNCWIERNKIEHDTMGFPEERNKEKKIEIIIGEHKNVGWKKLLLKRN